MPATPPRSLRRRIALAIGLSVCVLWLVSAATVFWYAARDRAAPADAIVVLGAAQYQGRPSPVLRTRLDHAVGLFARGLAPRVVLTGGSAEGDTASEAAVSRAYVLRAGVPDSVLLLENEGRTTSESLRGVAQLMQARGMTHVILVSDPFHLFRAAVVARRHGLTVHTSPTQADGAWKWLVRQPAYLLGESLKALFVLVFEW